MAENDDKDPSQNVETDTRDGCSAKALKPTAGTPKSAPHFPNDKKANPKKSKPSHGKCNNASANDTADCEREGSVTPNASSRWHENSAPSSGNFKSNSTSPCQRPAKKTPHDLSTTARHRFLKSPGQVLGGAFQKTMSCSKKKEPRTRKN